MSHDPYATFGVGRYGDPVQQRMADMTKGSMLVGTTQSGKTRLANSLARQQSRALGSGQIIINIKPDPNFAAGKARDAERLGKDFLHFSMAAKGGGGFQRSHPYAPPSPCHYDPLERGSGAVRARMLIDSVVHNDNSDVYRRTAIEISALAWDVARLSGAEWETVTALNGKRTRHKKRSMQVLLEMLELDNLSEAADRLTVDLAQRHHPHLLEQDARTLVDQLQARVRSIRADIGSKQSVMPSAIADIRSITGSFINSSAFYPQSLSPGAAGALRIDLLRAVVRGEIVLFDLPAADYRQEATMLTSMILLDLQNTVSTLREYTERAVRNGTMTAPWPPVIVQIEELGSAANAASAEALIGLLNKSADVGIRAITSTQSLADILNIDGGSGVYLDRLLGVTNDLISLQMGASDDDKAFCDWSGAVTKQVATEEVAVTNNRLNLFTGAAKAKQVRGTATPLPRVEYGKVQELRSIAEEDLREMIWITKTPNLTAVHSCGPEGPNNWHEIIQMVPVDEPPRGYRPFDDVDGVQRSEVAAKVAALHRTNSSLENPMLAELQHLNEAQLAAATEIPDRQPVASRPDLQAATGGQPDIADPWAGDGIPPADEPVPPDHAGPDDGDDPFSSSASPFAHSGDSDSPLPEF